MNLLTDFKTGDILYSRVPLVKIADATRYYVVEDAAYKGASTDGYGDYVPPETTIRVRLLKEDGTYDPESITAVLNTTWTANELYVQDEDGNSKNIRESDIAKLARSMKRVFV